MRRRPPVPFGVGTAYTSLDDAKPVEGSSFEIALAFWSIALPSEFGKNRRSATRMRSLMSGPTV